MDVNRPLLVTKLHIPPARPQWLVRERLLERLGLRPETALVLVSAPAGFGKTTLLVEWCHQLLGAGDRRKQDGKAGQRPRADVAVGWLSLDEGDNDSVRFLRYVLAALARALGEDVDLAPAIDALQSMPGAGSVQAMTILINALERSGKQCLLVLDDYQQISAPAVHSAVAYLVEHRPAGFHLAIGSRSTPPLPLSRLRVRGELVELSAADLRFSYQETALYLAQTAGLNLDQAQIENLLEHTEGWAAGLQLTALAIQAQLSREAGISPADFIAGFTHRPRTIIEYLMDEVFSQQPDRVQSFLLRTAPLERLNASLCATVLDDMDRVACLEMLEHLESHNLFTMPLDAERSWHRYHTFFADALRSRLEKVQPEWELELHRRASTWFERHGSFPEAIRHAMAIPDADLVARLLEQVCTEMLARGETGILEAWLDALGEARLNEHPRLQIARAWALAMRIEPQRLDALLEEIETSLQKAEDSLHALAPSDEVPYINGQVAAMRAFLSLSRRDPIRTIDLAESALRLLPEQDLFWRGVAARVLGEAYLWIGDQEAAARAIRKSSEISLASGNLSLGLSALSQLAGMQAAQGHLRAGEQIYRDALEMVVQRGWQRNPNTGILHAGLGSLLLEQNQLEAAEEHLQEAMELGAQGDLLPIVMSAIPALARLKLALNEPEEALALLDELGSALDQTAGAINRAPLAALKARFQLSQGNLRQASAWMDGSGLHDDDAMIQGREIEYLSLALVLAAQAGQNPGDARLAQAGDLLERLLPLAQASGNTASQIEILLALAFVRRAQGQRSDVLQLVEKALVLGEPEGYLRVFLDQGAKLADLLSEYVRMNAQDDREAARLKRYATRVLENFRIAQPESPLERDQAVAPELMPVELLSARELEVLRLVARGASNREIAEQLVVSVSTVKSHINHIMNKLDAQNRTEAAARARGLGLL